jgi:hypothetical protein
VSARIAWTKGGEASVVSLKDDAIVLRSSVPSPPGSRIEGVLAAETSQSVRVKIHSSKKQAEGDFVLEGRVLDMTRGLRDKLGAGAA